MNAVDATSRAVEDDTGAPPSLLTVILDTNPHAWNLLSSSLPLHKALASLLVFLNAHLAINPANQVAVLASHVERAQWLYPTPNKPSGGDTDMANGGGPVQQLSDEANKYRPFAAVERAITANLQALLATTTPSNLISTTTMTAGALTLALSHTSKLATSGPTSTQSAQTTAFNYSDPNSGTSDSRGAAAGALSSLPGALTSRILILSASPDNSAQYIPTMNAIFAAQRLGIPIDVLTLASASTFLQQAADATGGIHLARTTPTSHAGLLQTLMLGFLPDPTARQNLILPAQASGSGAGSGVDFRAACFCHRRIVDVGFVCSICLSIFCEPVPDGTCLTCGSHLVLASYGQKPAVVPRKKKKRKRAATEANGVETPGSAGGTPAPP
jgi:transcription initiation factor TFIIH subunit 3